jgi:membrane-associated protease RseP (regulator of RpoE activity)
VLSISIRAAESVPGALARWWPPFVLHGRGAPGASESQEYGFRVGLVLVLMLMVFAFYNDFHQVPWLKGCSEIVEAAFCDVAHWHAE